MDIVSVTDRRNSLRPLPEQVELICEAGAGMVVLREKDLPLDAYRALAEEIQGICASHGTEFCVNLHASVARELDSTLWLPFDLFIAEKPYAKRTGVSVHSVEEGIQASEWGADFVVYGNVFETACKPGKAARGLNDVKVLADCLDKPVYAIGGISPDNIREVMLSGASGSCLMSGLMAAKDPSKVVSECRTACQPRT